MAWAREQMAAEGTSFVTSYGVDASNVNALRSQFDALVLAGGATAWRDLPIPGSPVISTACACDSSMVAVSVASSIDSSWSRPTH